MIKRVLIALAVIALLAGCFRRKPVPAGRLLQPAGQFSFVTPEGWFRTRLAGIDFIIVSTDADAGFRPNIFVDFVEPSRELDHAVKKVIESYTAGHRKYNVASRTEFMTESGLAGVKLIAERENRDSLPLATFQYVIINADRTIAITCTCADSVKTKYEPVFDSAMRSLESEMTTE